MTRIRYRIAESGIPVHAAAERLVLRVPAPAQRAMLTGRPGVALDLGAVGANERDRARYPVRAVPGHLDGGVPVAAPVDDVPLLVSLDREAQGTRRAVAGRADNLVHPAPARGDERLLS